MASPITPTHGKLGALYVFFLNGFSGIGLNDATWGTAAANATSSYYEVVIDLEDTADTFKWRKNGGAWTEDVEITGAAQTLDEGQTITFAAVTGHTLNDQWVIGNLVDEPTTEVTNTAQITASARRILNVNRPPIFTDSGGKKVLSVNYTDGSAIFNDNVTIVDVDGNNGYIPLIALKKVMYLIDWNYSLSLDMADASRMGLEWKQALPGMAGGSGSANAYFIADSTLFNCLQAAVNVSQNYFLLQLFNYDPDQDQTGDCTVAWVTFTSFNLGATISEVVKEQVNFQIHGAVSFTANI